MRNGSMAKTAHKRSNFTDHQKAEIFVRDRATCAFSGISVWVLDHGASPTFEWDWVDHIKPSVRGGKNTIENGICASSFYNGKKKDNGSDNYYFFNEGMPTSVFFYVHEKLPPDIAHNLQRFAKLEIADWYFNRALADLLWAVNWLYNQSLGFRYVRDVKYYGKAAEKMLKIWRKTASKPHVNSFMERGLVLSPLSQDQKLMLTLSEVQNADEFCHLAHALLPYWRAHELVFDKMGEIRTPAQGARLLAFVKRKKHVSPRIKEIVQHNVRSLFG